VNEWIPLAVAFLGSGGAVALLDLLRARKQARKITAETELTDANAADKIIGAGLKLIEPLTKQLQAAETRCERLNEHLQTAQGEVQQLRGEVDRLTKDCVALRAENDALKGGG
jgi:peptidoglycan hydrolase CwlO-like protein